MNIYWLAYFIFSIAVVFIHWARYTINEKQTKLYDEDFHDRVRELDNQGLLVWFQFTVGVLVFTWYNLHITVKIG